MPPDAPPSRRFIWWVRCVILTLWAVLLVVGVPNVVSQADGILASKPPGPVRSQELRNLVAEAIIVYVAMPFIVLGVFGFGVIPRRNAATTGRPWFDLGWRSSGRSARRQRKDAD